MGGNKCRATCLHAHYGPDGANVLLGDAYKRHIGVHSPWIGGNVLTIANIAYMGPEAHSKDRRNFQHCDKCVGDGGARGTVG